MVFMVSPSLLLDHGASDTGVVGQGNGRVGLRVRIACAVCVVCAARTAPGARVASSTCAVCAAGVPCDGVCGVDAISPPNQRQAGRTSTPACRLRGTWSGDAPHGTSAGCTSPCVWTGRAKPDGPCGFSGHLPLRCTPGVCEGSKCPKIWAPGLCDTRSCFARPHAACGPQARKRPGLLDMRCIPHGRSVTLPPARPSARRAHGASARSPRARADHGAHARRSGAEERARERDVRRARTRACGSGAACVSACGRARGKRAARSVRRARLLQRGAHARAPSPWRWPGLLRRI